MNIYTLARIIGGFVLALGLIGIVAGETQLMGMMNTDIMLDMLRIALGGMLLAATFMGEKAVKTALTVFGAVYLGNFVVGLISPDMFGMLPHTLGIADNILHLGGGVLALVVALSPMGRTNVSRT